MGSAGALGVHLYLHLPYCASKCPYCDFNSIAGRDGEHAAYVEALLAELRRLPPGPYSTVFIGGGTPTALAPPLLERMLVGLRAHLRLAADYEWTCEANPGSADAERFALLAAHGVNRLSLGIQSLDERRLRFLGRVHDAAAARRALSAALAAFPRVSADLMYGLPGQTAAELRRELQELLAAGLAHLSAYHLAIEPGTEFHARAARGERLTCDPATSRVLDRAVEETLGAAGLRRYETSNYARPGAECRHNLAYWRQHDWQAAGAGAVSSIAGLRCTRHRHPAAYIAAIARGEDAIWRREVIDAPTRLREAWMLGLRLAEGVERARLCALGDDERRWLPIAQALAEAGLVTVDEASVRLAPGARYAQDEVTVRLMP